MSEGTDVWGLFWRGIFFSFFCRWHGVWGHRERARVRFTPGVGWDVFLVGLVGRLVGDTMVEALEGLHWDRSTFWKAVFRPLSLAGKQVEVIEVARRGVVMFSVVGYARPEHRWLEYRRLRRLWDASEGALEGGLVMII